jgi:saccharopine dehydrogenase-like NADP-dependent oxidoreductase
MRNILVIGAGKSCSYLTDYLQKKSTAENLHITIADISLENAKSSARNHPHSSALAI